MQHLRSQTSFFKYNTWQFGLKADVEACIKNVPHTIVSQPFSTLRQQQGPQHLKYRRGEGRGGEERGGEGEEGGKGGKGEGGRGNKNECEGVETCAMCQGGSSSDTMEETHMAAFHLLLTTTKHMCGFWAAEMVTLQLSNMTITYSTTCWWRLLLRDKMMQSLTRMHTYANSKSKMEPYCM